MISFELLVERTHGSVTSKIKQPIEREYVERILREADIPALLLAAQLPPDSPRIIIRSIWFRGLRPGDASGLLTQPFEYQCELKEGIAGWIAGNSRGKSTVLKLIVGALTGVFPVLKHDVRLWISAVAVNITIGENDQPITIIYSIGEGRNVSGAIYNAPLNDVAQGKPSLRAIVSFNGVEDMRQKVGMFMHERMGLAEGSSTRSWSMFPWEHFAQPIFISADDYHDILYPRSNGAFAKNHHAILPVFLGFSEFNMIWRMRAIAEQSQQSLNLYRQRRQAEDADIRTQRTYAEAQLQRVTKQIAAIEAEQSVLVEPLFIGESRKRVAELYDQHHPLTLREQLLLQEIDRVKQILARTRREIRRLEETQKLQVFFSGVVVDRCPNCEQHIPLVPLVEESVSGHCRVCKGMLQTLPQPETQEEKLAVFKNEEKKLKQSIDSMQKDVRLVTKERTEIEAQIAQENDLIRDFSRQIKQGFTVEYRELLNQQGRWQGQLVQLEQRTQVGQEERLQQLQNQAIIFQTAKVLLEQGVFHRHHKTLEYIQKQTLKFAQSFGIHALESVKITDSFEVIVQQGSVKTNYRDLDISEMLRIKIAFHFALLMVRVEHNIGWHPRLLVIDAPGNAELDSVRFGAFLTGLTELRLALGDEIQILIASTHRELEQACDIEQVFVSEEEQGVF